MSTLTLNSSLVSTDELVYISNGREVTTSRKVAEKFDKRHDHVLRDIGKIKGDVSDNFFLPNFGEIEYRDSKGRAQKEFEITKDGFSFLVMGYTGEKAGRFKEDFINEFNARTSMLQSEDYILQRSREILETRIIKLEQENKHLVTDNQIKDEIIKEQAPDVKYTREVLKSETSFTATTVAKQLGFASAKAFNKALRGKQIIFSQDGCYKLYSRYCNKGYERYTTYDYEDSMGKKGTRKQLEWTEKGIRFLYDKFDFEHI